MELGGGALVNKEGSLAKVLASVYPDETWFPGLFRAEESSDQKGSELSFEALMH